MLAIDQNEHHTGNKGAIYLKPTTLRIYAVRREAPSSLPQPQELGDFIGQHQPKITETEATLQSRFNTSQPQRGIRSPLG